MNRIVLASAGSGKTTQIVKEALDEAAGRVLITTFTTANAQKIEARICRIASTVPRRVTVLPWFTFLLKDGPLCQGSCSLS